VGTRTRGYIDYRYSDEGVWSPGAILRVLEKTTLACRAVEEYWRENDPHYEPDRFLDWAIFDKGESDQLKDHWWFAGPGHLSIRFCPKVAEIFAGARWRGFLTISPLRGVHRAALLAIARAVGATGIILVPDYADELVDAAEEGQGFVECLKLIEEKWGPMQGDLDEIRPAVVADCATCPPKVWFLQPT
jgi:hypothetical protein